MIVWNGGYYKHAVERKCSKNCSATLSKFLQNFRSIVRNDAICRKSYIKLPKGGVFLFRRLQKGRCKEGEGLISRSGAYSQIHITRS